MRERVFDSSRFRKMTASIGYCFFFGGENQRVEGKRGERLVAFTHLVRASMAGVYFIGSYLFWSKAIPQMGNIPAYLHCNLIGVEKRSCWDWIGLWGAVRRWR